MEVSDIKNLKSSERFCELLLYNFDMGNINFADTLLQLSDYTSRIVEITLENAE